MPIQSLVLLVALAQIGSPERELFELEKVSGGRLGVFALDGKSSRSITYRAEERFPMCSTFKVLAVGAVLRRADVGTLRLVKQSRYSKKDILPYSPVTQEHLKEGSLSLMALCEAAIEQSDNCAANLLLKELGGPSQFTQFCRILDDRVTRLDRTEPTLNSGVVGDLRDTTSPMMIGRDLVYLALGHWLQPDSKQRLTNWMIHCQTSPTLIRAGVPKDWKVADKSGMGGPDNKFGASNTRNDIAILWPPKGEPIIVAAYLTGCQLKGPERDAILAKVGSIVASAFQPK